MPYNNYLKFGFDNRPTFFSPGSKRIMFIRADAIVSLISAKKDVIDSIILRSGELWNMFNDLDNVSILREPKTDQSGTIYNFEVSFTVNVQTTNKNRLFNTMRNTDLVAIVEDQNFRWWLIGLEQPLRLTSEQSKTDNDTNQYIIKLTTSQRENIKEMSSEFTDYLTNDMFSPMVDSVDGLNLNMSLNISTTNIIPELPNNFLKTITAPPSGYIIASDIGVVFATAGSTLKLPSVAINGQQHTVKDYQGLSSVQNITVSGNGNLIDGGDSFVLNTDFASITFTYNLNNWFATGFVN